MKAQELRMEVQTMNLGDAAGTSKAEGLESAAKVKCPALFILGQRDVITPLRTTASAAGTIHAVKF
jgi:pimeloyl-ACP methyl ester carboxylesterase